jgi:hypothetical protein
VEVGVSSPLTSTEELRARPRLDVGSRRGLKAEPLVEPQQEESAYVVRATGSGFLRQISLDKL